MAYPQQFRLAPLLVAISSASGLSSLAYAQEKESMLLEEVVVTAQRQQTLLQETPIAVTVFSEEQIQDLGIFTVADINALAPNTNIQKQPSSNSNMSIFIRGVGSGETALMVDPKVSFYIDGVYMSKTVGGVFANGRPLESSIGSNLLIKTIKVWEINTIIMSAGLGEDAEARHL